MNAYRRGIIKGKNEIGPGSAGNTVILGLTTARSGYD